MKRKQILLKHFVMSSFYVFLLQCYKAGCLIDTIYMALCLTTQYNTFHLACCPRHDTKAINHANKTSLTSMSNDSQEHVIQWQQ